MKIILLSIALITAGFLTATAQNNISLPKKYQGENARFEYPDFEKSQLPTIKKINSGQDWWEPDTVCAIIMVGENRWDERVINKYNSHGLLKEYIQQRWRNNSWVNIDYYSCTYTYDSNNNVLTRLGPGQTTYTYDSNNNILTERIQKWENDLLVNYMLHTYTYDSNNNMLTHLRQLWKNNSWKNDWLNTYTYDSNNNLITHLSQDIWINNSWSSDYTHRYTYTYDSNNNRLTELRQRQSDNSWINSGLVTYTYDSNNNRLTELLQNGLGENHWLATYTYDSNNNMPTKKLVQNWQNNSWVNMEQYLMTYDENGNGTSVEFWFWIRDSWLTISTDIMTETILYYNNMQSNFRWGCHKLTASYINVANLTAIAKPPATQGLNTVSIYPNPTKGELRIENGELRIQQVSFFDITGIHLFSTQQTTLDVSHLPAGIYFVQIKTEKGMVAKKIVKW